LGAIWIEPNSNIHIFLFVAAQVSLQQLLESQTQEVDRKKIELEGATLELEKVRESLVFERKELDNVKGATEKREAEICQLEVAIADKEHDLQAKILEVEKRKLSLDLRLKEVENLEQAVWLEEKKYEAEHQKIVALNEEIGRDRLELDIVRKELQIEKEQIEVRHEHHRNLKELDQQQIEDEWAKVRKDWELVKENMEERKRVEDEIHGKCQQLEQQKEMLNKEFQQKICELENETSAERERLKKEVHLERQKQQDEIEADREKAVQEREKAWMEIAEERQDIAQQWEDLKVLEVEQIKLAKVRLQLKQELDEIREHKCFVDEEAKELKMWKEKFEQEWELLDEKRETVEKDVERFEEESKHRREWLKHSEEQLRISKHEIQEQSLKMAEELKEQDAWKTKMETERTQLYAQLHAERQVLVHNLEMQCAEFDCLVLQEKEVIEKLMEERKAQLQSEIEKEELKRSKRSVLMEMEQLQFEHQKLEHERQDLGTQREEADKEQIEIHKDIENLDLQLQKLKEQWQNLHQEQEEILAEKLHKLRADLTEADNSLHIAEPAIHHQIKPEARFQQQEVNPVPVQKMTPSAPECAASTLRSPGTIAWLQSCASRASQLFSQPSELTGMVVANVPERRKGGTVSESCEHGDNPDQDKNLRHSLSLNQSQLAQVLCTEKQMRPYKHTQSIRAIVEDAIRMVGSETPHKVSHSSEQKPAAGGLDRPQTGKKRSCGVAVKEQDDDETKFEVEGERPHKRQLCDILHMSMGGPNGGSLCGVTCPLPIVSPGSQRCNFLPTTMYVFHSKNFSHLGASSNQTNERMLISRPLPMPSLKWVSGSCTLSVAVAVS